MEDGQRDQPANVLEYERVRRIRKRGERGLLIMAWVLGPLMIASGMSVLSEFLRSTDLLRLDNLVILTMALGAVAWGATYLMSAILFRRGRRWAGWTAGAMTLAMAIVFLLLSLRGLYEMFSDMDPDVSPLIYAVPAVFAAFEAGLVAAMVEAWRAMRVRPQ